MDFGINDWCKSKGVVQLATNDGMPLRIDDQLFKTTAIFYRLPCWA